MVLLGFPGYLGHHQDFWILGVRERRINKRVLRGTKVENLRMDQMLPLRFFSQEE